MGKIRIVGPGKTCGYPYLVCKTIQGGMTGMILELTDKSK